MAWAPGPPSALTRLPWPPQRRWTWSKRGGPTLSSSPSTRSPLRSSHDANECGNGCPKMFGYPTGLGALLVADEAAAFLKRAYFGGGTVSGYF